MKNVDLSTMTALSLAATRAAHHARQRTAAPLASTSPGRDERPREAGELPGHLQAAVGRHIEAVAVPGDDNLVLLVNKDGLLRKLPPHPWASAAALHPRVGDAVLMPRAFLC